MKRFSVVAIGSDNLYIDRYPLYRWPVRAFLDVVHTVTYCRACWWSPVYRLDMKFLNTPSKETFCIPVDSDMRVRLAASYGIPLRDDEDDECPTE